MILKVSSTNIFLSVDDTFLLINTYGTINYLHI